MQAIYVLIDPRDEQEFYVGRTEDVFRRFKQHLNCDGSNVEKNNRICELQSLYLLPIMKTIEVVEDALAIEREAYWIQHFVSLGRKLLNRGIEKALTFDAFMAYFQSDEQSSSNQVTSQGRKYVMTITEVANQFNCSPKTVQRAIRNGQLKLYRNSTENVLVSSLKNFTTSRRRRVNV